MKTLKLIVAAALVVAASAAAHGQFGERLGRAIQRSAEDATVRKSEQKTDEAVSTTIDKATDADTYRGKSNKEKGWNCPSCGAAGNTGKFCTGCGAKQSDESGWKCTACGHKGNNGKFCAECGAKQPEAKQAQEQQTDESAQEQEQKPVENLPQASTAEKPAAQPKALEASYAKSDFAPGDEIIFADELDKEKMGEFPSRWDLIEGSAEVAKLAGHSAIYFEEHGVVAPLMKDMKGYLPEVFTMELDYLFDKSERRIFYDLHFYKGDDAVMLVTIDVYGTQQALSWQYTSAGGESRSGALYSIPLQEHWNHVAVSFNKRAFKLYFNGSRVINIPSMAAPSRCTLSANVHNRDGYPAAIKDFRMAQGAVPLYDRMMSDGKIVTYGITFDVGKATLKPESMTEINRIAQLMKDNPSIKFSVEGHTDNSGSAATNQTLSDARSKAVADKLVEMGVDKNRLAAAGKGQNSPIADNATDEGRAKNRRVEFVKM